MSENTRHPMISPPVLAAHWRRADRRRYASGAERHAELVVLLGLKGAARYLVDGRILSLRPGALLWALAGQAHVLLDDSPDFDMWVMLVAREAHPGPDAGPDASPEMPPFALGTHGQGIPLHILPASAMAELTTIAEGLADLATPELKRAGYHWWLTRAWAHWRAAPVGRQSLVHPAVDRAVQALQRDPEVPLADLARQAGLSAGRLGQVFKAQTGKSIVGFRTETRLARVDRIMESHPGADLLGAALDAGFGSYSQFFRAFQQHRQSAPRAWYAP